MRSDLGHLPATKQRELECVVQIIFEDFDDVLALATQSWKKKDRIAKIILYSSYARGGWVDEPHTAKGYQSDYDLFIIVNDKRLTDRATYWSKLDDRLIREFGVTKTLCTPANFIVDSLEEVNDGLVNGRYFFMDIARDRIALYEVDTTALAEPRPMSPQATLAMAIEYYDGWMAAANKRLAIAKFDLDQGYLKEAAFDLHQSTERLYHCCLLVCAYYTPHVHNRTFLRTQAERADVRLMEAWPRTARIDRSLFEKLKDAYVKARYSKHYRISHEELDWLNNRVDLLARIVEQVCLDRISQLEATVGQAS